MGLSGLMGRTRSYGRTMNTSEPIGVYRPARWGEFWKAKRNAAHSSTATVAIIGDSISAGKWSTDLLAKSYVGLLATTLQATYGNGGSGYAGTMRTLDADAGMSGYIAATGLVGSTGTWSTAGTDGPGLRSLLTQTAGSTLTFPFIGTRMTIYYLTTTTAGPTAGKWGYAIDGGASTLVDGYAATPAMSTLTVDNLPPGAHTVTITMGSATGYGVICGVSGENRTGVIVNNFAKSGARAAEYVTAGNQFGINQPPWNGGAAYPCDLLVYAVGLNDAHDGVAPDTYAASIRKFLDGTKGAAGTLGAMDIIFLLPHIHTYDNATPMYHLYVERLRGIAEGYGAAFVNIWGMYRNNAQYWAHGMSAASTGTPNGQTGSDVHPNDIGHQLIADALLPVIES